MVPPADRQLDAQLRDSTGYRSAPIGEPFLGQNDTETRNGS
jgi:hypothetical protein